MPYDGVATLLGRQMIRDLGGSQKKFAWPEDPDSCLMLKAYGFAHAGSHAAGSRAAEEFDFEFNTSDGTWEGFPSSLSATAKDLAFNFVELNDSLVEDIAKGLRRFTSIRKIQFTGMYFQLQVDSWALLLSSIPSTVEDFAFKGAGLNDTNSKGLAKELRRFISVKKVDFSFIEDVQAEGWALLLNSLPGTVEDISFVGCGLNDTTCEGLAKELHRFVSIKTIDFSDNSNLQADGWALLLNGLPSTVEEFRFENCGLDEDNCKGLAKELHRFTSVKKIDFSGNVMLGTDTWALLLESLSTTTQHVDFSRGEHLQGDEQATRIVSSMLRWKSAPGGLMITFCCNDSIAHDILLSQARSCYTFIDFPEDVNRRDKAKHMGGSPAGSEFKQVAELECTPANHCNSLSPSFAWMCVSACERYDLDLSHTSDNFLQAWLPSLNTSSTELCLKNMSCKPSWFPVFASVKIVKLAPELTADSLAFLLSSLPNTVEEFSFNNCLFNDDQCKSLAKGLHRFTSIKKIDFSSNYDLNADSWALVLSSLPSTVEDLCFSDFDFDDTKCEVLAKELPRFISMKKIDFSDNEYLQADSWALLLGSLPRTAEDFSFRDCFPDGGKSLAKELERFTSIKKVDFS